MDADTFGRLVREHGDLTVRVFQLQDFVGTDSHFALSTESKELLDRQLDLEIDLLSVLQERISLERQ